MEPQTSPGHSWRHLVLHHPLLVVSAESAALLLRCVQAAVTSQRVPCLTHVLKVSLSLCSAAIAADSDIRWQPIGIAMVFVCLQQCHSSAPGSIFSDAAHRKKNVSPALCPGQSHSIPGHQVPLCIPVLLTQRHIPLLAFSSSCMNPKEDKVLALSWKITCI